MWLANKQHFGVILGEILKFTILEKHYNYSLKLIVAVSNRYTKPSSKVYYITGTLIFGGFGVNRGKRIGLISPCYQRLFVRVTQLVIFTKLRSKKNLILTVFKHVINENLRTSIVLILSSPHLNYTTSSLYVGIKVQKIKRELEKMLPGICSV